MLGQPTDINNLNVNQFSFGGDLRFKLSWFQAEALLLYSAGDVNSLNADNGLYINTGSGLLGVQVVFWV